MVSNNSTKQISRVGTWEVRSTYGSKHVRFATEVFFTDGTSLKFMERLSKKEAVKQAEWQVLVHKAKQ